MGERFRWDAFIDTGEAIRQTIKEFADVGTVLEVD
jgi:hypothetical protein